MKNVMIFIVILFLLLFSGLVIANKYKQQNENPTITIIQEVSYEKGQLVARMKGNQIQFLLDGEIFARGVVHEDGTFYIPIDSDKQTEIKYTKAYNKIRTKLTNQKQLE